MKNQGARALGYCDGAAADFPRVQEEADTVLTLNTLFPLNERVAQSANRIAEVLRAAGIAPDPLTAVGMMALASHLLDELEGRPVASEVLPTLAPDAPHH